MCISSQETIHPSLRRPVRGGHAIVIGGSIAGLAAARVLAQYVERVTLIERDQISDVPAARKGVPHGRHAHLLLLEGQRILEGFFPGLDAELAAAGAVLFDWVDDMQWITFAGPKLRFASDLRSHVCSRELLEWAIRRRVLAHASITVLDRCEVTALRCDATGRRVAGVTVRRAGDASQAEEFAMDADLIVDASGRRSRAPQWLQALGYLAPRETDNRCAPGLCKPYLSYARGVRVRRMSHRWAEPSPPEIPVATTPPIAGHTGGPLCNRRRTTTYRMPEGFGAWKALYLQRTHAADTRGGLVLPLEGDRWMVTLVGVGGDYPSTEEASFLEFARSLKHRQLYDAIKDAAPLAPIHGFRGANNRRRHFEELARHPERFVALGDAFCAFNPVYGQGMTTAALGAQELDRCLRERSPADTTSLDGFAVSFYKRLARVVDTPWSLSIAQDLRLPRTEGGRAGILAGLLHRYVDEATRLATADRLVHLALTNVLHLRTPPRALFHPRIMMRVLAHAINRSAGGTPVGGMLPVNPEPA